ncbi:MAG: helix-turn-helix transcriptional regulator [Comamonas sp.]|jgi:AraC-like DNA-binding protein|nr:helix-turn-helix transcriptional regulator [Comamonas sp.]
MSMAWLAPHKAFDADREAAAHGVPALGVAVRLEPDWPDSGRHTHQLGQLLYSAQGCMRIVLADRLVMLPPTRIAWIPPQTPHRTQMTRVTDYRSLYLDILRYPGLPQQVQVWTATELLQAVLERLAQLPFATDWQDGPTSRLLQVAFDELQRANSESMVLPLPSDRRLASWLQALGTQVPPPLHVLAEQIGASSRTITRIFQRDTGMGYLQWRQQWRLMRAIELLTEPSSLQWVAHALDFSTDAAFAGFFRQMTGLPPRSYMARRQLGVEQLSQGDEGAN